MVYAVSGTNKKNEGNKKKIGKCGYSAITLYILDSKAQDRICSQRLISSWVHTLPVCRNVYVFFILTSYSSSGGRRSQLSYVSHVINQSSRQQLNFDLFTKLSAWLPAWLPTACQPAWPFSLLLHFTLSSVPKVVEFVMQTCARRCTQVSRWARYLDYVGM